MSKNVKSIEQILKEYKAGKIDEDTVYTLIEKKIEENNEYINNLRKRKKKII